MNDILNDRHFYSFLRVAIIAKTAGSIGKVCLVLPEKHFALLPGMWKRWKRKIFAEAKDESGCGKRISFSLPLLAIHIEIQSLMWCNFLKIISNCKKTFLKSLVSTRSDHCSFLLRLQHSFNLYHNNKAKAND